MKSDEHVDDVRKRITWLDAQRAAAVRELDALTAAATPELLRPYPAPLRWLESATFRVHVQRDANDRLTVDQGVTLDPAWEHPPELKRWLAERTDSVLSMRTRYGAVFLVVQHGRDVFLSCPWLPRHDVSTPATLHNVIDNLAADVPPLKIIVDTTLLKKDRDDLSQQHADLCNLIARLEREEP